MDKAFLSHALDCTHAHHLGPKQLIELQKGFTVEIFSKMGVCHFEPTRGIEPRTSSLRMKC